MKRTMAILLAAILAVSLLTACGASNSTADQGLGYGYSSGGGNTAPAAAPAPSASPGVLYNAMSAAKTGYDYEYDYDYEYPDTGEMIETQVEVGRYDGENHSDVSGTLPEAGGMAEKIIYTANADIETIDFDASIEMVDELIRLNNAFIEYSYQSGRNFAQSYYGYQTYRTANYTIRVPKERFNAMKDNLDILGNVTSLSTNAENITSQFRDMESLLASYRIQEERLLAMLEKTDTVTDMITIESRLAEVRYSIESYTSTLNNWQTQVDYSTLTLFIREVEKLSETVPIQRSYWQQVGDGLQATTRNVGEFFTQLFKWIVVNLPVLAILAIIVIVIVLLVKRGRNKKRKLRNYNNNYGNNYNNNNNSANIGDNSNNSENNGNNSP